MAKRPQTKIKFDPDFDLKIYPKEWSAEELAEAKAFCQSTSCSANSRKKA
jgi:hypothetical protein